MRNPQSHHRLFDDFPVGTRVRIVCHGQDFNFFRGDETGEVIANSGKYLGILVKYDVSRWFENNHRGQPPIEQTDFNFGPADLLVEGEPVNSDTVRPMDDWPELTWPDVKTGLFA